MSEYWIVALRWDALVRWVHTDVDVREHVPDWRSPWWLYLSAHKDRTSAVRFSSKKSAREAADLIVQNFRKMNDGKRPVLLFVRVTTRPRKPIGASLVGFDDVQFPVAHTYPEHLAEQWAQTEAVKVKLRNAVHAARRWRTKRDAARGALRKVLDLWKLHGFRDCPSPEEYFALGELWKELGP